MDKLDKALVDSLRADFPPEAIQVRSDFKDAKTGKSKTLVGYKPQYVVERLNDIFGHFGWDFIIIDHGIDANQVWAQCRLSVFNVRVKDDASPDNTYVSRELLGQREQFGMGTIDKDMSFGDALKSAATDAMGKCASWFDVGHKAYKGLETVPDDHPKKKEVENNAQQLQREEAITELVQECRKYKIGKDAFPVLVKTVLKEEKTIDDINDEEITQLINHIKKNGAPF